MTKNTQLIFHSFELVQISRVISGTAVIWLFSLIDLILLGRIFNQAKKLLEPLRTRILKKPPTQSLPKNYDYFVLNKTVA